MHNLNRVLVYRVILSVISCSIVLGSVPAFSQPIPMNGNLYGQPIVSSSASFGTGASPYVATSNTVYKYHGGIAGFGAEYQPYFKPPEGTTITHIELKDSLEGIDTTITEEGDTTYDEIRKTVLLITLSNGVVVYDDFSSEATGGSDVVEEGEIESTEYSEGFEETIGDALYCLSSSHVYVCRDQTLRTWQVDSAGLGGAHVWAIALNAKLFLYAATTNGLFVQNPDSDVWHQVTSLTQASSLYRIFIDRRNRILVGGNGGGLYLSTDNGISWTVDTSGIGTGGASLMADDYRGNLYVVASNSITNSGNIYKSVAGTSPWQITDSSITAFAGSASSNINSLSGDSILIAGTPWGPFISTDQGATWTLNNSGISSETITGIAKTRSGKILLSNALGIYSNNPHDTSWTKSYPQNGFEGNLPLYQDELGNFYTLDGNIGNFQYGISAIIKTTDGGNTWAPDTTGLRSVIGSVFFVDKTGTEHYGSSFYEGSVKSSLWSKAPGGSWTIDTTGFPVLSYSFVECMASDDSSNLYVSGYFGGQRVMRRPIAGGTWVVDTEGIPSTISYFYKMAGNRGTVVGSTGNSLIYRSSNSWINLALPTQLSFPGISAVCIDDSGIVFAAFTTYPNIGHGVYFTRDNGANWVYAGLDSIYVTTLTSFGDSTYALTYDAGAFYVGKNPPLTGVRQKSSEANTFSLSQNYPNPFNPSTVISYQLSVNSRVALKVYDVLGRVLATLVYGVQTAGKHSVTFDASRFASGVYFYRLEAKSEDGKSFVSTKKLMLIK